MPANAPLPDGWYGLPPGLKLPTTIVLVDSRAEISAEIQKMFSQATFLYGKEFALKATFEDAVREMLTMRLLYNERLQHVLANPPAAVVAQKLFEGPPFEANTMIWLEDLQLAAFFKTFVVLTKSALDKLMPFFSYRFSENLQQFSDKGERLLKSIAQNKHIEHKNEMMALIEQAKLDWLDELITMRDEYTHYGTLKEFGMLYSNLNALSRRRPASMADFEPPPLRLKSGPVPAHEYMQCICDRLIAFVRDFLALCDFNNARAPRNYLACEECDQVFAKRDKKAPPGQNIKVLVKSLRFEAVNEQRDYAVIICPKCWGRTDARLSFWKEAMAREGG